jgi:predicted O-methyltransferase YrrM
MARFTILDEAGVREMVEHHAEKSEIVLPRLLDKARSFDLAFVDGNLRFDGVFVDLFYLGRLVQPGGIVFLDDYQLPGVARPHSSRRTWTGPWRKSRPRTTCTSGRYCVPPRFPTHDRLTTSSIFEARLHAESG